ncbi:MAG: rod-binding protein [Longimicrobiales bacterium]
MTGPVGGAGAVRGDALEALRTGRIQGDAERLRAASKLLEGTFYQELFKAMRETVPEGGAVSGGAGQEMFEGMLDQHIADASALRSDQGLGQALYAFFMRGADAAEAASVPTPDIREG